MKKGLHNFQKIFVLFVVVSVICFFRKEFLGRILKPLRLIMFTLFGPYFVRDVRYWPIYILKSFFWLRKYWSNFKLFYQVDATLTLILFSKSYFSGKAFWKRLLHKFWAEGAHVLSRSRITLLKSPQIVWFYLITL